MTKKSPQFIIIDGNALIHRSFHALPPTLTTKDGLLVNAVYGFTNFILKAFLELKPEYVVLTLDRPAPTFRHKEYSAYKATREKAPDELYAQIPLVEEVARAFDIPIFAKDGYEADDLIGTITKKAEEETNWENIIITGDMDTFQLISKRTKVYMMSRGLSEAVLYGEEEVINRYGLKPQQIVDYKALRGDASDNIPGVKGIGEKSAIELLKTFNNLDNLYQAIEKNDKNIKARVKDLLLKDKDNAYLSQRLAQINREVPIKIKWEDFKLNSFEEEKVNKVLQKLEFRSLINKVKQIKNLSAEAEEKEQLKPIYQNKFDRNQKEKKYQLITDDKSFAVFLKKLKEKKFFALDTETEGLDPLKAQLLGLSFSWQKNEAYYLHLGAKINKNTDLFTYQEKEIIHDWLKQLKDILEDEKIKKCGHNLKFDWRVLKNHGINLQGLAFDSLLASYLLNPDNRQHDLDSVSFRELGWEKISTEELIGKGKEAISFSQVNPEKMAQYAGEDADCAWQLKTILLKKLKEKKLDKLFFNLELPLITILGEMENYGIKLNPKPLAQLAKTLANRLNVITKKIYHLSKEEFNLNSPKQLQHILFDNLQLDSRGLKKNKTGISTADEELKKLSNQHEIIALIQEYRELNKLQNTYVLALPKMIHPKDGRIHTSYNQSITSTGRLSSTDPNLQNIPIRSEEGKAIRTAFIASEGYSLLSLDYSQIELRLAAHFSQDQKMILAFKNKEDIHAATAAAINNVDLKEVTKEMRRLAKTINFGILYGQGPHGLSQTVGISYAQAKDFIDRYLKLYPGIKIMMDKFIDLARQKGYAETLFGRRRPLPDLNSNLPQLRKAAERMAINTPIQGTAADMIKKAMLDIALYLQDKQDEIKLLLQVHDELIFEIKSNKLATHLEPLKQIMAKALPLSVPIIVEASSGQNWGELK